MSGLWIDGEFVLQSTIEDRLARAATPKTDRMDNCTIAADVDGYIAMRNHARQLERDLAAANERHDVLHKQFEEMRRRWQLRDLYAAQQEERAERAEAERDALRAGLNDPKYFYDDGGVLVDRKRILADIDSAKARKP